MSSFRGDSFKISPLDYFCYPNRYNKVIFIGSEEIFSDYVCIVTSVVDPIASYLDLDPEVPPKFFYPRFMFSVLRRKNLKYPLKKSMSLKTKKHSGAGRNFY